MSELLSRRDLFDRLRGGTKSVRPPYSQPDALFVEACTGCGKCISSCPQSILIRGRGGYPQVDFSNNSCTFCGACADSCEADAFIASRATADAWTLRAEISKSCLEYKGVSCRACEAWCDTSAIRFRPALGGRTDILLDTDLCTGCGACVQSCPQKAISIAQFDQSETHILEATA